MSMKVNEVMLGDIVSVSGRPIHVTLAEGCKRYWLFLKWERFNEDIIVNIIPSCYKEETNSCEFYLKEEE